MGKIEQYGDWRAVWLGIMTIPEYEEKYPNDRSFAGSVESKHYQGHASRR